jgi:hypothetical protein
MTGHKNYLQADYLLGPGPRLIKKRNLPGRALIKFEKHCPIASPDSSTGYGVAMVTVYVGATR